MIVGAQVALAEALRSHPVAFAYVFVVGATLGLILGVTW